jgi:hypothetical protein
MTTPPENYAMKNVRPEAILTRRERERHREIWTGRRVSELSAQDVARAAAAGYEPDGAWLVGRDPRKLTQDELKALGHEAMSPMEAIRARCLDCCAGSSDEVRKCVAIACPSWPFRTGKNPWRAPPSEAQVAARRQAGARLVRRKAPEISPTP